MAITIEEVIHQQVGNTVCVGTIIRLKDCIHIKVHTGVRNSVWDSVGDSVWDSVLDSVETSVKDILVQSI